MATSARRAFRLPVLAIGLSLMAWAGLTFSAVAPPGCDMEIGFGKYSGMKISELDEEDLSYCQWVAYGDHRDPHQELLNARQWIRENKPEIAEMMSFGKYKGMLLADIDEEDPQYLDYLQEEAQKQRGEPRVQMALVLDWLQKHRQKLGAC